MLVDKLGGGVLVAFVAPCPRCMLLQDYKGGIKVGDLIVCGVGARSQVCADLFYLSAVIYSIGIK